MKSLNQELTKDARKQYNTLLSFPYVDKDLYLTSLCRTFLF